MLERFRRVFNNPNFRREPLRYLISRFRWRLHWWTSPNQPLIWHNWYRGLTIALPRSGSAASSFYRGHPHLGMCKGMGQTLRPGDIAVDIGAHIGEYTLVAAHLVGPRGKVYAIEPQPQCVETIQLNARLNGFENINVQQLAVGDQSGWVSFRHDPRTLGGLVVREGGSLIVESVTLDEFLARENIKVIKLIKIDAAGNEKAVLVGGQHVLTQENPPFLVIKLYNPRVVKERFGYEACEWVELLALWGYTMKALIKKNEVLISPDNCYDLFSEQTYGFPVLAWKG